MPETSIYIRYLLMLSIGVLIVFPLLSLLRITRIYRLFGVPPSKSSIVIEGLHDVNIDEHGTGHLTVQRRMLFIKDPKPGDLTDWFSVSRELDYKKFEYHSEDAREIDRMRRGRHRLVIFWLPNSEIELNLPYIHAFKWSYPRCYTDPANYFENLQHQTCGIYRLIIKSFKEIEHAIAFRKPKFKRLKTEQSIYKYALTVKRTRCSQPEIDSSHKKVILTIKSPKKGELYYCVFFYNGGVQHTKDKLAIKT